MEAVSACLGGVSRMGDSYRPELDPGESKDPRAEMRWQGGETAALRRVQQRLGQRNGGVSGPFKAIFALKTAGKQGSTASWTAFHTCF